MHTDGAWFKDEDGRTLILRGVNLSGATKVPTSPDGATWKKKSYLDSRSVSFVGRPFPIEEADEHFKRLRTWGFTFLRFLVTWEAVEHAGPGEYDREYLDYLRMVIEKAAHHGIHVFIDPHQDMWSRWTGGDGAPGWTMELLGMDLKKLHESGASIIHAFHGDNLPQMIWVTNQSRYGAATMFTLFFGGSDFAPKTLVEGVPVQEYLQDHYIDSIKEIARTLKGLPNVHGFDTLNEPLSGFIGVDDLSTGRSDIKYGYWHTFYESIILASGHSVKAPLYSYRGMAIRETGAGVLNPDRISIWKKGHECVWKTNGVWTESKGTPELLAPHHFRSAGGKKVDFRADYLKPFVKKFMKGIRSVEKKTLVFIEENIGNGHIPWSAADGDGCVNATHWYDVATLFSKNFIPFFAIDPFRGIRIVSGIRGLCREFVRQLADKKKYGELMGGIPTLIGEFGLSFDLKKKKAYRTGNFSAHVRALDTYFNAMDALLLSCTLWNYTPDNTNERGDLWNDEDLSIFSRDQQTDPADINSGGRAIMGFVRPYARKVNGIPVSMSFNRKTRVFRFSCRTPAVSRRPDMMYPGADAKKTPETSGDTHARISPELPTEIFVPKLQYPGGYDVMLTDGRYRIDRENDILLVYHAAEKEEHTVVIKPKRPVAPAG